MVYELELPLGSKVHNVFHVLCLKKVLGQHVTTVVEFLPLNDDGHLVLVLEAIFESRERRLSSRVIKDFLIK